MDAEVWEIYYVLILAWDSGWKKIKVQIDSQFALDLIADRGAKVFRVANSVKIIVILSIKVEKSRW